MFEDALNTRGSAERAAETVLSELSDDLDDEDDAVVIWLALATLLLDHGVRHHRVIDEAKRILRAGAGLERWKAAGQTALAERMSVYDGLLGKLK
jgi:hypothetical protein